MCCKELKRLRMTEIKYFTECCCFGSLQFTFSNGESSPPANFYDDKPNNVYKMDEDTCGYKFTFQMRRCRSNFKICCIEVICRRDITLAELQGRDA